LLQYTQWSEKVTQGRPDDNKRSSI